MIIHAGSSLGITTAIQIHTVDYNNVRFLCRQDLNAKLAMLFLVEISQAFEFLSY